MTHEEVQDAALSIFDIFYLVNIEAVVRRCTSK